MNIPGLETKQGTVRNKRKMQRLTARTSDQGRDVRKSELMLVGSLNHHVHNVFKVPFNSPVIADIVAGLCQATLTDNIDTQFTIGRYSAIS